MNNADLDRLAADIRAAIERYADARVADASLAWTTRTAERVHADPHDEAIRLSAALRVALAPSSPDEEAA